MANIAVLGAGIVGLSTAVAIQQRIPGASVTVIAEGLTTATTSDGAGGIFVPYAPGTDVSLIRRWGKDGAKHFYDIAFSDQSAEAGVYVSHGYEMYTEHQQEMPVKLEFGLSSRRLNQEELERFHPYYKDGWFFSTVIVESRKYLPWMMKRFQGKGGRIENRHVENLEQVGRRFDVVVNCTGLGSRDLVPDPQVTPLRGQVVRVYAPWIKFFIHADDGIYVLPSSENVCVGGTKVEGDESTVPYADLSKALLEKAQERLPALKGARPLWDWVGLRPQREAPRLDTEIRPVGGDGKTIKIVHNYGHGAFGVSLSWGTGVHAAEMAAKLLSASKL